MAGEDIPPTPDDEVLANLARQTTTPAVLELRAQLVARDCALIGRVSFSDPTLQTSLIRDWLARRDHA